MAGALVSDLAALRDGWYAVGLADPKRRGRLDRVRLFGEDYVLFVPTNSPAVLIEPGCPHRGTHLDAASVLGETLQCCYHGWEFDSTGACVRIPQLEPGLPIPSRAWLRTWPVVERYGAYWTCVGDPIDAGPPSWTEADDLGWRVQVDFFEAWAVSAFRIIDNNIDQSHPAFVHRGTFGDPTRPLVPEYELQRTTRGFRARIAHEVLGVGPQMGVADENLRFERTTEVELLDPMHTRILLAYGGTAPDYCFYGSATPIDDDHSIYVRISALMGDPVVQPYDMFWDFSRRVTNEDRIVLEANDPHFPLDLTAEVHLGCDRTTVEYRRLLGGLAARSVDEVDRTVPSRIDTVV